MRRQIDEAADTFGVDFDVVAVRAAADSPARLLERLVEQSQDVLVEPVGPLAAERALDADDAVAVQRAHDRRRIELLHKTGSHAVFGKQKPARLGRGAETTVARREGYSSAGTSPSCRFKSPALVANSRAVARAIVPSRTRRSSSR